MERLTNRDKEIPLPNANNALFWARVHEKLARYEDAEEQAHIGSKPKTYCEKWPTGCMFCDLLMCDGKKDMVGKALEVKHGEGGQLTLAPKPITNADRIRHMTDEELAETFDLLTRTKPETKDDKQEWLDWLKREAENV